MPVIAIPKEQAAAEKRIAIVPEVAVKLEKLGAKIQIEKGLGISAFLQDEAFSSANVIEDSASLYKDADIILKVQAPTLDEIKQMPANSVLIGSLAPFQNLDIVTALKEANITALSMELIPRISRAQAMDVLSSQATVAGYKAVLMAADLAPVFLPMLTTAAGTIRPSKVLIIGAGVAGLQAIATARRLGAIVEGYDVRSATKEQVESLGAKFVEMPFKAEGEGGYARPLTDEEKQQQQEVLAKRVADSQIVITTAAIPGRASPKIISSAMVEAMAAGSVIIDLAAEGGGNCELSQPGETILHHNVIIHAPLNVPSQMPTHASDMYSRNLYNLLALMIKDGKLTLDWEDEILQGCVLTHAGEIKNAAVAEAIANAQG